jgi:hypothetical protein
MVMPFRYAVGRMMMRLMMGSRGAEYVARLAPEMESLVDLFNSGTDWLVRDAPLLILFCADSAGGSPMSINATDLEVGVEMLENHTDLGVLGDKGYISAEHAAQLWRKNRVRLRTIPRRNQKVQLSSYAKKVHNSIRQIIETVNGQLSEQFNIEKNHAHTFWGLCTRLYTKLTAHTLCIYINRLMGKPDFL